MATYEDRLGWIDELIEWFESLDPADLTVDVSNCPGWTVRNVLAHLAGGGIGWVAQQSSPASSMAEVAATMQRATSVLPQGRSAELFGGTMRVLSGVLRSHAADDACHYYWPGAQCYDSYARHVAAEVRLHQLDVQQALDAAPTISPAQAGDGIRWTAECAMPGLVAMVGASTPAGSVMLQLEDGEGYSIGEGDQVAAVAGPAIDVFTMLWNRGGTAEVSGEADVVDWWISLPGQLTGATRE